MPDRPAPLEPRSHPWIWVVYGFLFAASVPWYLPAGSPPRLWLGLPHWVVIALAAYLAVAVFTAWVVARYWPAGDGASRPATSGGAAAIGAADHASANPAGRGGTASNDTAASPPGDAGGAA